MKRRVIAIAVPSAVFLLSLALFVGVQILAFSVLGHFGFNNQATPYYGFTSGPGPMVETAVLGSTILVGLWNHINCHQDGCYRIGKHKVQGTPWCNEHHESARHHRTMEDLAEEQNDLLRMIVSQNNTLLTNLEIK